MGDVIMANGFDWPTAQAGGANYLWYALGPECDRAPYRLIPNYDQPGVRAQAQQQLADMHSEGMRALSIGIAFRDGYPTSTLIDASDPTQVNDAAQNLHDLLQDIQAAGFQSVLFRFFPQSNMNPSDKEGRFDSGTVDLYWNLIQAMHAQLASTFLPYKVDLGVELAPADSNDWWRPDDQKWKYPANNAWSKAVRKLWRNYKQAYGTADSVGFSFLGGTDRAKRRMRHMRYVYEGDYPSELAMDLYGEPQQGIQVHDVGDQFIEMARWVRHYSNSYGFPMPYIIISETWYNNPWAAASLSSAIAATGQPVSFLTEWPLEQGATCTDVSVAPPYDFDIYHLYGF